MPAQTMEQQEGATSTIYTPALCDTFLGGGSMGTGSVIDLLGECMQ